MTRTLKARHQRGVLQPLHGVDVPEGATVELTVVPAGWSERLRDLLARVQRRAHGVPANDMEAEITEAAREVREQRSERP